MKAAGSAKQVELDNIDKINTQRVDNSSLEEEQYHSIATNRPHYTIMALVTYGFKNLVSYTFITCNSDLITFWDIVGSLEKSKWIEVMMEEIES